MADHNNAVLLIDMQDSFLNMLLSERREKMIENQLSVLGVCKNYAVPVVVLEYYGRGSTTDILKNAVAQVPVHEYFVKSTDDGFQGEVFSKNYQKFGEQISLSCVLNGFGIYDLYIMGINSSFCVVETAKSAVDKGFRVFTSEMLIAQQKFYDLAGIDYYSQWFKQKGRIYSGIDEIINELSSDR